MKKFFSLVLVLTMVLASSVAFAAAPQTADNQDGTYTTSGSDQALANKMMTILVNKGQDITVDSIQYIDQTTADASGNYSFANYIPKSVTAELSVKVGGQGISTPLAAGTIVPDFVKLTGVVTYTGTLTPATITFTSTENPSDVFSAETTLAGAFEIDVVPGTYNLVVSKPGHTKYIYNGISVSEYQENLAYTIYGGDATGEGTIDVSDITRICYDFMDPVTEANKNSDVNDDGGIDVNDITRLCYNFLKSNTVLPVVAE